MEDWTEYLQTFDSFTVPAWSIEASFGKAAIDRHNYRHWLIRKIEENALNDNLTDSEQNSSYLLSELDRLQFPGDDDDQGTNRWYARPTLDDLEYGCLEPEPILDQEAESHSNHFGFFAQEESASNTIDLLSIIEHRFSSRVEANNFAKRIKESYAKGDHTLQFLRAELQELSLQPYVIFVVKSDPNWFHRNMIAYARDKILEKALGLIEKATSISQLKKYQSRSKTYSRDMQILQSGRTFDGDFVTGRKIGIGWDYKRFATAMNAIARKAKTLGDESFKSYPINEFEKTETDQNGDIMDFGCRTGEFMMEELEAETESLWSQLEPPFQLSPHCKERLEKAGPTSFVWRPWYDIILQHELWLGQSKRKAA